MSYLFATMLFVLSSSVLAADSPDDRNALQGVKAGKVIFDINMAEPKKMTLYLDVIKQTVDDLVLLNCI